MRLHLAIILCCLCILAFSFHLSPQTIHKRRHDASSALNLQWQFFQKTAPAFSSNENGLDASYPWRFEGRFIFRPSLVRVPSDSKDYPPCSKLISLFGYTIGGSVVLEYDVSPVGPYREYVKMGGLVALGRVSVGKSLDGGAEQTNILGLGQWGTSLYVSTQVAEDVCKEVWGVPAIVADIEFEESGDILRDGPDTVAARQKFNLSGWKSARILTSTNTSDSINRFGNIPILWTPTIKALWAPVYFPSKGSNNDIDNEKALPVHRLRLSASAIGLQLCERVQNEQSYDEIPLGLALVVDNVMIEIGRRVSSGSISIFSED
ncbi:hypothetical protein ACHAXN_005838 [Cyclotella atomus]